MRLACVQSHVVFADPIANVQNAIARLKALKAEGVDLAIFPEAYLTGYCVDNAEDAAKIAISSQSEALIQLREACESLDILAVVGYAETDGDHLYNAAALFEPGQEPRFYRKTHLPELGLDKFVEPGQALPTFDTRLGRVGMLICFDLRPPEATRVLALNGAELIILPTNWPVGAEVSAGHICIARASENRVFVATCNRVGTENGFTFIGQSKIIDISGRVLAAAGAEEATIIADIELSHAQQKRTIAIPGKYETEVFSSRNTALYGTLLNS